MGLSNSIQDLTGVLTVQVEGFFTERFINLCKMRNVKIWDIRNIVKGVVRFKMHISDFKKLRPIARKTKCRVIIKEKRGLYFTLFRYRKRKLIFILAFLLIFFSIAFSTFIWNIDITGNETISNEAIMQALKDNGVYVGRTKFGFDRKQTVSDIRVSMPDLSWIGIELEGTTAKVKVVEKTKLREEDIQRTIPGDIVANKAGIITKIVPENGTAKFREGSYVEPGTVLIEGMIYSKFMEPSPVVSKGIVKIDSEYTFEKSYSFESINREYTGKTRYTIGIGINSKENMLNYLNKSKKYDITKSSKTIKIFGQEISFDLYRCVEYVENTISKTKEELMEEAKQDAQQYLDKEVLPNTVEGVLTSEDQNIVDTAEGIEAHITYTVNERIGEFVERAS